MRSGRKKIRQEMAFLAVVETYETVKPVAKVLKMTAPDPQTPSPLL